LTSFDEFEDDSLLAERDLQDYQSIYIDLYQDFKGEKTGDKENIMMILSLKWNLLGR